MGQERLSQLSLINIEYTIAQSISYDSVLNTFASMRKRKLALLNAGCYDMHLVAKEYLFAYILCNHEPQPCCT